MMDTGAHRRTASNSSSTVAGDVKPALVSNVPINFAMKFLANTAVASSQNGLTSSHPPTNSLHLHLHSNGITSVAAAPATTASTPLVAVKLEPRVPSPCTADLVKGESRVASPCVKDLSFYLAKSAVATGQNLLNGSSNMSSVVEDRMVNGGNVTSALSLKQLRRVAEDGAFLPGQTHLPTSVSSPSPPPLLPNGHFTISQSPTTTSINSAFSSGKMGHHLLKRDHDDAFGASSTTPGGPVTSINVSSSNNSLASLPSSTNSPSPPPLLTNGHHHQAMINQMLPNGGNIASPTSSSFSDFGSTGKCASLNSAYSLPPPPSQSVSYSVLFIVIV